MVTISIRPYTVRKVGFVGLALFCLSCLSTFAQSTYISVHSTPYDRQMARIRPILASAAGHGEQNLSFALVNHWIGDLRAIPYGFSMEWKTPEEVQTSAFADCKGKALALYNTMHSRGAQNVRLVIGKRLSTSEKTHAWLSGAQLAAHTYSIRPLIGLHVARTVPAECPTFHFMPMPAGKNFALRQHRSFTPRINFWLGDESQADSS